MARGACKIERFGLRVLWGPPLSFTRLGSARRSVSLILSVVRHLQLRPLAAIMRSRSARRACHKRGLLSGAPRSKAVRPDMVLASRITRPLGSAELNKSERKLATVSNPRVALSHGWCLLHRQKLSSPLCGFLRSPAVLLKLQQRDSGMPSKLLQTHVPQFGFVHHVGWWGEGTQNRPQKHASCTHANL